ncbi:MAG TPA: type II toxin-antitoxin system RelE/ParE family toxin [Tepidisphaeraceae bacterium]|jgi:plasmid stabilization system protein ParE
MKYRISRRADRDIEEICDYIALDKPSAADRFDEKLNQTIQMLADFPGAGHIRTDVKDRRYLFWSVGNYVIAYRLEKKKLIVVRVLHGARDFRRLFRED